MGRTVPTYVSLISQIATKWSKFRRVLRREDQFHFDRLLRAVRYFAPAGMYQCSDDPRESVVLSMFLSHEKRVAAMEERLKMPTMHIPTPTTGELFTEVPVAEAPEEGDESGGADEGPEI
jgi:hypothetical protein